jgi:hypothetical protein
MGGRNNAARAVRERANSATRAEERPTLSSTIARGKATDPFSRAHEPPR